MGKFMTFLTYALPILGIAMYLSPFFTFHMIVLLDFFTPFKSFKSDWVSSYHRSLVDPMPVIPARELPEIKLEDLSHETLRVESHDYTKPLVIRNALGNMEVLKKWDNISWWIENYGDEEVSESGSEVRQT